MLLVFLVNLLKIFAVLLLVLVVKFDKIVGALTAVLLNLLVKLLVLQLNVNLINLLL